MQYNKIMTEYDMSPGRLFQRFVMIYAVVRYHTAVESNGGMVL